MDEEQHYESFNMDNDYEGLEEVRCVVCVRGVLRVGAGVSVQHDGRRMRMCVCVCSWKCSVYS